MDECESACPPAMEAQPTSPELEGTSLTLEELRKQFGARLQLARKEAGQSQKDIIHLTRISPPFVKALEEGNFEILPGEVFGRGFIKNICKVLDVDSAPLLVAYQRCWEEKPSKIKNYNYTFTKKFSATKLRAEPKLKGMFPFSNYFSSKGAVLWLGVPTLLVLSTLALVWKGSTKGPDSRSSANVNRQAESKKQAVAESKGTTATSESHTAKGEANLASKEQPAASADPTKADAKGLASDSITESSSKIKEISPKGFSLSAQGEGSQSEVLIEVRQEVSIRYRLDQEAYQEEVYPQGQYRFHFRDKADFFIPETQKVAISFNKRPLGEFGPHRDRKQLTFFNQELKDEVAL